MHQKNEFLAADRASSQRLVVTEISRQGTGATIAPLSVASMKRDHAILSRTWKAIALAALIVLVSQQSYAQVTCPVTLIGGDAGQDSIKLSFMNKNKVPIQQLVLSCSPPLNQKAKGGVCHTEGGIFYPGTEYTIDIPYPGASRRPVTISLKTAILAGGIIWNSTPAEACRTLRVLKKK